MLKPQMLETIFVLGCACVGLLLGSPAGNPIRESVHYTVELVANGPCHALEITTVEMHNSLARLRFGTLAGIHR